MVNQVFITLNAIIGISGLSKNGKKATNAKLQKIISNKILGLVPSAGKSTIRAKIDAAIFWFLEIAMKAKVKYCNDK